MSKIILWATTSSGLVKEELTWEEWGYTEDQWKNISSQEREDIIWGWATSQGLDYGFDIVKDEEEK